MGAEILELEKFGDGPRNGYAASRHNATRHGILSRRLLTLPWEEQADYDALQASLDAEYRPATPTERHLVEELAGIIWRKQRVYMAEDSAFRQAAASEIGKSSFNAPDYVSAALVATNAETDALRRGVKSLADGVTHVEAEQAEKNLGYWQEQQQRFDANGQEVAMALLTAEDKADWQRYRERAENFRRMADYPPLSENRIFADWLDSHLLGCREQLAKHQHAPALRQQVIGVAYAAESLVSISRYETHLDRKFERMLMTLLKLQNLRRFSGGTASERG